MTLAYVPPAAVPADVKSDRDLLADERGSGRLASAPLPQCGGEDEDHQDCSREGRQSTAGGWFSEQAGSLNEAQAAWYRVTAGGRVNGEFVMATFNTQVDVGGFFGLGLRDRLESATATLHPGLEVLDFWPMSSPPIG